jgi:hypothetical protein
MAALALAGSTSNTLAQPTSRQPSPAVHPAAAPLSVELGAPISYSCGGGQPLTVRYGRLSDGRPTTAWSYSSSSTRAETRPLRTASTNAA